MPHQGITLEKLAMLVQQGFDSLEGRLERLERVQDTIRRQIANAIYAPEFHHLETRVGRLERRGGIKTK